MVACVLLTFVCCEVDSSFATDTKHMKGCLPSTRTFTQVEEFVATAGADANDVQSALEGVQHMSWAGGGILRRKNLVLLAFADVSAYSIGVAPRRVAPRRAPEPLNCTDHISPNLCCDESSCGLDCVHVVVAMVPAEVVPELLVELNQSNVARVFACSSSRCVVELMLRPTMRRECFVLF